MKKIFYLILLLALSGCNNLLDILPDDKPELDDAFINEYNTEKYLFTCYKHIPSYADPNNTLGLTGGGEIMYHEQDKTKTMSGGMPAPMKAFFMGNKADSPYMNFWDGYGLWQGIRHCNVFLEKVPLENGGPKDLSEKKRNLWMAEVRALRAFYHFYLFRLYGPIPIMDHVIPISAEEEDLQIYRNTTDEVVNFIVTELDKAIEFLPERAEMDQSTEFGRFNKTIARCIKAKALVLAASPLFNNNNYYKGYKDNRGIELFPEGDSQARWQAALQACDDACRSAEADGNIILITQDAGGNAITGTHIGNINDTIKAMVSLRQAVTEPWNMEIIWALNQNMRTLQMYSSMISNSEWSQSLGADQDELGIRHAPTMNFTELFYSSNGLPIEEDNDWSQNGWYINRYKVQDVDAEHSKYFIKKGYRTAILHFNRSLRFYASVSFDGGLWEGRLKSLDRTDFAQFWSGKGCGERNYGSYGAFSTTGYLTKKLVHLKSKYTDEKIDFMDEHTSFPVIRLADMYLLLAEALNEVGGPGQTDSKGKTAADYLDEIRARSGMKGVVESYQKHAKPEFRNKPASQEGMREIIRRERINELAFEGSFYYDVRRWLMGENFLSQPTKGWNYKGVNEVEFYTPIILAQPKFTMRDYLMPIRTATLLQDKNLVQNPGW